MTVYLTQCQERSLKPDTSLNRTKTPKTDGLVNSYLLSLKKLPVTWTKLTTLLGNL